MDNGNKFDKIKGIQLGFGGTLRSLYVYNEVTKERDKEPPPPKYTIQQIIEIYGK